MEIGSEFEWQYNKQEIKHSLSWLPYAENSTFTFCGRTAIELVLDNIPYATRALVPAYCCDSMLVPFRNANIDIKFYQIFSGKEAIEVSIDEEILMRSDVLLICNYFGFDVSYPWEVIDAFYRKGGIIVEDITHSLLSEKNDKHNVDYYVASLRKWGALLDGGYCSGRKPFEKSFSDVPSDEFLQLKSVAMKNKMEYLQGKTKNKQAFLTEFGESNRWLAENFSGRVMSSNSLDVLQSWNIDQIKTQRIRNVEALYKGLQDVNYLTPLFSREHMICPLFFPVSVAPEMRADLRNYLIKNDIYCPVHWPKPSEAPKSDLYDCELSLICDQRYTETDMERIVNVIKAFK